MTPEDEPSNPSERSRARTNSIISLISPKKSAPTLGVPDHILKALAKKKKRGLIFNPKSPWMLRWDVLMTLCLVFTALVTPYEVAFLETTLNAMFILNRGIDILFFMDMIKNFFTPYFDKTDLVLKEDHYNIAKNYITSWFLIDLVSILPFDSLGLMLDTGDNDVFGRLKILRFIRLLRLLKLMRIFRASRILSRWEDNLGLSYAHINLAKFFVIVLCCAHWMGCSFRLVVSIEETPVNWMSNYYSFDGENFKYAYHLEEYILSLYWSIMTMSTIGYGDVLPVTPVERFVCLICMTAGASVYAYVIGAICSVVANMNQTETLYRQTLDNLNNYMDDVELPLEMRIRLREYFRYARVLQKDQFHRELLLQMSPHLRGEVAMFVNSEWVAHIPFFNPQSIHEKELFTVALAVALTPAVFAPDDVVIKADEATTNLYVILRGLVTRRGQILRSGDYFGEEMIMLEPLANASVRAITFIDVQALSKDALMLIMDRNALPQVKTMIRKAAIRLCLMREVIHLAKGVRTLNALLPGAVPQNFSIANPKYYAAVKKASSDVLFKTQLSAMTDSMQALTNKLKRNLIHELTHENNKYMKTTKAARNDRIRKRNEFKAAGKKATEDALQRQKDAAEGQDALQVVLRKMYGGAPSQSFQLTDSNPVSSGVIAEHQESSFDLPMGSNSTRGVSPNGGGGGGGMMMDAGAVQAMMSQMAQMQQMQMIQMQQMQQMQGGGGSSSSNRGTSQTTSPTNQGLSGKFPFFASPASSRTSTPGSGILGTMMGGASKSQSPGSAGGSGAMVVGAGSLTASGPPETSGSALVLGSQGAKQRAGDVISGKIGGGGRTAVAAKTPLPTRPKRTIVMNSSGGGSSGSGSGLASSSASTSTTTLQVMKRGGESVVALSDRPNGPYMGNTTTAATAAAGTGGGVTGGGGGEAGGGVAGSSEPRRRVSFDSGQAASSLVPPVSRGLLSGEVRSDTREMDRVVGQHVARVYMAMARHQQDVQNMMEDMMLDVHRMMARSEGGDSDTVGSHNSSRVSTARRDE